MSTNRHTAISAGAAATAATLNAPLGQLDAALVPAVASYAATAVASTTCTAGSTAYAVTSFEVSFTPAYTGQVFLVAFVAGVIYSNTAGTMSYTVRITDGASATIVADFITIKKKAGAANDYDTGSGVRAWTAGAGDVGVTRKAKVYTEHSVAGSINSVEFRSIQALSN